MFRIGLSPPIVSPRHIFIGKNGFPMFLVPFFSATYTCQKIYYQTPDKPPSEKTAPPKGKEAPPPFAKDTHYYIYPYFETIPDHGSVTMFLRSCSSYKVSKLLHMEGYWESLKASTAYAMTRTILFMLTGSPPLFQSKPVTLPQLITMMQNQVKTLPALSKIVAGIKKKSAPEFKPFLELLSTCVTKPDQQLLRQMLEALEPAVPQENQIVNTFGYTLDLLSAASFMEEQADNLLDAPMRRVIYLPCKLVFNGYFHQRYIESAKFYYGNNLISSLNFDEKDKNTFNCDYYLEENRTLLATIVKGNLKEAIYFIKGTGISEEKITEETNIKMDKFFEGSWVPGEELWTNSITNFVSADPDDGRLSSLSKEPSVQVGHAFSEKPGFKFPQQRQ